MTFGDGVVFGRKISELCFLLRFLAFFVCFGFSRFLPFFFISLSSLWLSVWDFGKIEREGGREGGTRTG